MNHTLFWILAGTLLAASVLTVTLRRAASAVASALVATMALAGACVLLDAPWLGATVVVIQGSTVLIAGLAAWFARTPGAAIEPMSWRDIAWGSVLTTALVIELAWMLQRLTPAPFAPVPDDVGWPPGMHTGIVLVPLLALITLLLGVAGVKASRKDL